MDVPARVTELDKNSVANSVASTTIAAMSVVTNTTPFNLTEDQYLVARLGPRHKVMVEAVILTIVYVILFLTGVIGNVSTCIVIARNNYMHTATNYYLFSLAISDVLTLVTGLPPELYTFWEAYPWMFGKPFCLFKIFLQEMTSSASVLTITAFTVERYVAICHPIRAQTMSTLSRAIKVIVLLWLASALASIAYPIHADTFYYVEHPVSGQPLLDSLQCNIRPEYISNMKYMFQFSTFILFIAPMTIITVLYMMIGLTLRGSGLGRKSSDGNNTSCVTAAPQSRKSVLKMLVAVVVAFFICWAPFHAQRLLTTFVPDKDWTPKLLKIQEVLFYISGILYFVGSTVNPLLYNMMSKKYRQAFKETLCRCCMSPEDRRLHRDNKGHLYSTDRSHTYVTVTGSNSTYYQSNLYKSPYQRNHFTRSPRASPKASPRASPVPSPTPSATPSAINMNTLSPAYEPEKNNPTLQGQEGSHPSPCTGFGDGGPAVPPGDTSDNSVSFSPPSSPVGLEPGITDTAISMTTFVKSSDVISTSDQSSNDVTCASDNDITDESSSQQLPPPPAYDVIFSKDNNKQTGTFL